MAAAYVSGVAALLESASIATTPATVRDALMCGAEDDIAADGYDQFYGWGHLKADLSMNWRNNSTSCKVTVPNDNLQSATVIPALPFGNNQSISDRSVTEQLSDPQICGAFREQTVWYRFVPGASGYFQFSTLGSTYTTAIGVFRGGAGVLTSVGCNDSTSPTPGQLIVPLDALQIYYIAVGTDSGVVDNQILQIRVNPAALTNNTDFQDTGAPFAYVGMWGKVAVAAASGGYIHQTTDPDAMVAFSFRGTQFKYSRTVGPNRGSVQFYINGSSTPITVSNQGAALKYNQITDYILVPGANIGSWNTVYMKRDPNVPGLVDIDRIRTFDFDVNTLAGVINAGATNEIADDRDARLRYITVVSSNDWAKIPFNGAYKNTLTETGIQNAGVAFRFYGNSVSVSRMIGGGFADMQITVDNSTTFTVSNTGTTNVIRPFMIDNLPTAQHVVEIRKLGATGTIQLDAIQGFVKVALAAGTIYDERHVALSYRGDWTNNGSVTGAYVATTRSLPVGAEVSFKILSNDLCVGYKRPNLPLNIYIDGASTPTWTIAEDSVGTGFTVWCIENKMHTLLADTIHYVRLVPQTGTTATNFTLDYIKPQRTVTLTPASGIVQEVNAAFRYSAAGAWQNLTTAAISVGGFAPRGGSLKRTSIDGTTITFYINGTGFILYTSVGSSTGCWETSVDDVVTDPIDTTSPAVQIRRYRPLGYAISGLTPGIHRIQLTADINCSSIPGGPFPSTYPVDFDAVRVFP